jgi:hypothetical protein
VVTSSLAVRHSSVIGVLACVLVLAGVVAERGLAASSCTNAGYLGFEEFLPGCGTYERVTPPFKAGSQVLPRAVSGDGSRVVSEATGSFAGEEGDSRTAFYESVRSETGWITSALDPSSLLFPAQELEDVSADLSRSLWVVRSPAESTVAENLAVREPDRSFAVIGPMVPPSAAAGPAAGEVQGFADATELQYASATSNLSRVLFEIRGAGPKWPGDTTQINNGTESLYEYAGKGETEPKLVGINGEGVLISDCGSALGSINPSGLETADGYNAVSADGESVFFTAAGHQGGNGCKSTSHAPEVNEVYARVGLGAAAHTVAISEPTVADCIGCQPPVTQANAEFQGASEDGSKVFFFTEQELFKEATGMNLYEYDFHNRPGYKLIRVSIGAKEPEVLGVARVSEDGTHVYFVAQGALTSGSNAEGAEPVQGEPNLYVFERDPAHPTGHLAFIATLSPQDSADWSATDSRPVQATPDGRFLVFQSLEDLTSGDASSVTQVFEYDSNKEELVRVSVGEPGYAPGMASAEVSASRIPRQKFAKVVSAAQATTSVAISTDGSVVIFRSNGGLTAQTAAAGEAGSESAYEYRSSGAISNGKVYALSNGSSGFNAIAVGTDASGSDVLLSAEAPLLPSDGDTQIDLYDVRAGGGFAPVTVEDCVKVLSGCHGVVGGVPRFGGVESLGAPEGEVPVVPLASGHVVKPLSASGNARMLAKALKTCRKKRHGHGRRVCEVSARRRFGSVRATKGRG